MSFHFSPALRERVPLIIAVAGASGGGKTLSALKLARGLAGGDDSRIGYIDTEAARALHYAVAPGEQPSADRFAFQHGDLKPPFTPEAYAEAIKAADEGGQFEVIVVDSCSHEWEGEGGLHDQHERAVADAVERARASHQSHWGPFDETKVAERASVGAWKEPKRRHKQFVSRLLQCRAHLILCLRAEEKLRIETVVATNQQGREYKKTVIVQPNDLAPEERWTPICEKRFMFEMTISLVVSPERPGVPIPIKLQSQHRESIPLDRPLSEDAGRKWAAWARGGATPSPQPTGHAVAADRPAPSHVSVAGDASGAGTAAEPAVVPHYTADEYIAEWNERLADAAGADDAQTLGMRWNADIEKQIRRTIFAPNDTRLGALVTRVANRIAELKRQPAGEDRS